MRQTLVWSLLLWSPWLQATPLPIQNLYGELESKNDEVQASKLQTEFSYQTLRGSLSRKYPSISGTYTANQSGDNALATNNNLNTGTGSSDGTLGTQSNAGTNLTELNNGYSAQAQISYFLFSKYAIPEDIRRSRNSYKTAKINQEVVRDSKRSQLLQLLLEWQVLNQVQPAIDDAKSMIDRVQSFAKKRSNVLYTQQDRANLNEKATSINYNHVKVHEGIMLVESALQNLIPDLRRERLKRLPRISVDYSVPAFQEMKIRYVKQSRTHEMNDLSVDSAKGWVNASEWNRPWIPTVYWTASYSYSGNWEGENEDNGASTSVMLSWTIFDGFYTQARLAQARIHLEAQRLKQGIEADRRVLKMKHDRMKALVAKAEYEMKQAFARKKQLRYLDVKRKIKQGIGSRLDLSATTLEYVKAQMEALGAMKDYQQSILNIAVELNEFDKVKVDENPS